MNINIDKLLRNAILGRSADSGSQRAGFEDHSSLSELWSAQSPTHSRPLSFSFSAAPHRRSAQSTSSDGRGIAWGKFSYGGASKANKHDASAPSSFRSGILAVRGSSLYELWCNGVLQHTHFGRCFGIGDSSSGSAIWDLTKIHRHAKKTLESHPLGASLMRAPQSALSMANDGL
jgi:hypothetical protein